MNGKLAELKNIVNNPNIPKSEKLKEAQRIMGDTYRTVDTFTTFAKSKEFQDLPTEEEFVEDVKADTQAETEQSNTEMQEIQAEQTPTEESTQHEAVDDFKSGIQLEDVHQAENDVLEEMKDIEGKHLGKRESSVRIDVTV